MSDVMIYANDLTKNYGSFRALDKVSFEVEKGEIVGFLGPNGAGKSTTMRILTCFIAPTSGRAKVNGYDVFDDPLGVRRSLGYLPQRAPLYQEMAVLEYLKFASELRHLDEATFKKNAKNVVEVCGLAQVLGKPIRQLSHGYRQRVGLAQALIHDPPILILDEPTSDLDPNEKAEFLEYLKQIGKDRTVMLSTHNLSEVETACARAIIVRKGRVVADGPLDEIRARSGKVRYVVRIQETAEGYKGKGAPPTAAEVEEALRALPGAQALKELPTDERVHAYALSGDQDSDLRADIFSLAVQKGWVLLELVREVQTLENVFRNLTIGDELRNRKIGAAAEEEYDEDEDDEDDEEEKPSRSGSKSSSRDEEDGEEEDEEDEDEDEDDEEEDDEEDDDEEEDEEEEDEDDEPKKGKR
jgi:ABC-2 type transport system ATP-binding protein